MLRAFGPVQEAVDVYRPTSRELARTAPPVASLLKAGLLPATGIPLGGTLASLPLSVLQWPEPSLREAAGHQAQLKLAADSPVAELARKELELAQTADARVTAGDMYRAVERAEAAEQLEPVPQSNLYGFTRLTDARFPMTAEVFARMVDRVAERHGVDEVGRALGGARSEHPLVNAVARIAAQLKNGDGASLQLNIDQEQEAFLLGCLDADTLALAMGGAGGFCANMGAAQPNVESTFVAPDGLPLSMGERMSPQVRVADDEGRLRAPNQVLSRALLDRTNYIAEYRAAESVRLLAGTPYEETFPISGSSRVILSTPGGNEINFGDASADTLAGLIRDKALFFCAGSHYLTRNPDEAAVLRDQLAVMKAVNRACTFHLQYVVPKNPDHELTVLDMLGPQFDSLSLNAVEVSPLLERFRAAGRTDWAGSAQVEREVMEHPEQLLENALALKSALGLPRLHVHGHHGDLLIARTPRDRERQVLALLKARQMASMKAANLSGEIKEKGDMWPILPLVEGVSLAMVQKFADAIARRFDLTPEQRDRVARDWYYDDGQGNTIFFVPSRGIHDRTGGTVSLGDTIDSTALIYGRE
ncbi:MAG: ADP-dependent glucokinase/phosphofructokinase [Candidatus Eremiobacterota bacterium]